MLKHFIVTLLIFFILVPIIHSQNDSVSFILPESKLYQHEKKVEDIYYFEKDKTRLIVFHDTLFADPSIYKYNVALNKIDKVAFRDGTNVLPGFAYAGLGGFLFGFILGVAVPDGPGGGEGHPNIQLPGQGPLAGLIVGSALGLACAIGGAIVGLLTPYYEEYEMKDKDVLKKRDRLNKIFNKWNLKRTKDK
jgi:hypothetical protein